QPMGTRPRMAASARRGRLMARFANCVREGERFAAVVDGSRVRPLQGIAPMTAGCDYDSLGKAERGPSIALADVRLEAPVLAPGKVICLGLNYLGHVTET